MYRCLRTLLLCLCLLPPVQAADTRDPVPQQPLFDLLREVLEPWGLPPRFAPAPSDELDSIRALLDTSPPLLAYNPGWITTLRAEGDRPVDWIGYAKAVHQIAHLQLDHRSLSAQAELEAEWYTGFTLAIRGASLAQTRASRIPPADSDSAAWERAQAYWAMLTAGWQAGNNARTLVARGEALYLIAHSSYHPVSAEELTGFDRKQLRRARNEIFARHGYRFEDPGLRDYFRNRPWYRAQDKTVTLSPLEQANVALIRAQEELRPDMPPPVAAAQKLTRTRDTATARYLYPASSERLLTRDELRGLGPAALGLIRNELFARHGYRFSSAPLQRYFARQRWYQPRDGRVALSRIEEANVTLLRTLEQEARH